MREKTAFFCLFDNKICYNSVNTEHTPKGPQGLLSMLSFRQSSFLSTESAGKLGFGLVPSRTSRPPGKGLIARGDLGMTGSVSVTDLTSPVAKPPEDKTVHRNGFRYKLAPLRGKPDVQDSVCPSQLPATSVRSPVRFTETSKHTEEHTPHTYLNTALLFFSFLMATDLKSIPRPLPKLN